MARRLAAIFTDPTPQIANCFRWLYTFPSGSRQSKLPARVPKSQVITRSFFPRLYSAIAIMMGNASVPRACISLLSPKHEHALDKTLPWKGDLLSYKEIPQTFRWFGGKIMLLPFSCFSMLRWFWGEHDVAAALINLTRAWAKCTPRPVMLGFWSHCVCQG